MKNEWLDRALDKAHQEGFRIGRILAHIEIRREDGFSDEKITNELMRKFQLTEDQAKEYIQELDIVTK